jgi:DNA-binding transcriptional regulator YiaG
MSSRSQYSEEEIKRISLRIKSARVLSGLNQEEFAQANSIPYMSLKGWEMGKALPRQTGLLKFLKALSSNGIQVDSDWLLCGTGAGPTYVAGARPEVVVRKSLYMEQQVSLFKKEQEANGFNPLVVEVKDDAMSPRYNSGDIMGGVLISSDELIAKKFDARKGAVYLIRIEENIFAPRQIFVNQDRLFFSSFKENELFEYATPVLAKICWHYFPESQT